MPEPIFYSSLPSPMGELQIASTESGICRITFLSGDAVYRWLEMQFEDYHLVEKHNEHKVVHQQLTAYFHQELTEFTFLLDMRGTGFQKKVWQALLKIPYGRTTTYGEIARQLGDIKQSRAVGTANGANPIPIVVPCHRVIGSNGNLIGYSGGVHIKEYLLKLEGAIFI